MELFTMNKVGTRVFVGLAAVAMSVSPAFAGTTNNSLPWEGPLQTIATSLTGPVAFSIAVIAMAATGGMLVFGGELTEVTRKSCILVLAIAFLVGGAALMRTLFGVSAALI